MSRFYSDFGLAKRPEFGWKFRLDPPFLEALKNDLKSLK